MTMLVLEAESLEAALGDPSESGPFSRESVVAYDEAEAFPLEAWDAMLAHGYFDNFVPVDQGGALHAFDRLLLLGRVLARRDLTTAIAAGQCLLGALPVWLAGTSAQRARVATRLRAGEAGALALTEEGHGSDVGATATSARAIEGGYVLDGTKWAINNATRGAFLTVLARTEVSGPRALSLFLVEKDAVASGACAPTPKLRTHGIRGADISGVRIFGCSLPEGACIGREGDGLALVLQTMQVSRTMCSAFSLGAADTALRLAIDFATTRVLYGEPAIALPAVKREVRDAFVAIMLADALAIFATRALSLMPEQMSVLSAVTKVAVPELSLEAIRRAAVVLGARHYMRGGRYGIFQKILRDAPLIALFDGSSAVNRSIVAGQLPRLVAARLDETSRSRLRHCATLTESTPRFDPAKLNTSNRGSDDVLAGLADAMDRLSDTASAGTCLRLDALGIAHTAFAAEVSDAGALDPKSETAQRLADRYVALVTASVLVHVHAAADRPSEDDDALLGVALDTVLTSLGVAHVHPDDEGHRARVDARILAMAVRGQLFSHVPIALSESLARPA